jgi:hypothetical protein
MAKMYVDTYLYRQYPEYEKKLYGFILNASRIDTSSKEFQDILYDVKRRKISDALTKIIISDNVVLGISDDGPLPKAFKVFAAKDVKENKNKIKVFIDVSGVIKFENGVYVCKNLEWFMSYIINAMVSYIYAVAPNKLLGNSSILKDGGDAFVHALSYIVDRLYKISTVRDIKLRVEYLIAIYWQVCIIGKSLEKDYDSIIANAIKLSGIDKRNAAAVDILYNNYEKIEDRAPFNNIDLFVNSLSKLGFKDIKTANFVSYWMSAFGTGTVFGMEYFPAFSAMLTNTYVGGYLDQQITIEKVTANSMVSFTKTILQIGASVV